MLNVARDIKVLLNLLVSVSLFRCCKGTACQVSHAIGKYPVFLFRENP
jgi:hypothetical protein